MKFIGQYIQQLIARFRSDVYLENISTSSETGVLVVDSDGKITKNTGISGGLASTVTVTDSTSSTNFPIVFHNESNGLLDSQQFEYNPAILTLSVSNINASSNITASNNLTSNGAFILNQNDNDAVGFITNAYKLRGASGVGQNSDHIFDLRANSRDGAGNATIYSRFLSKIVSVTDGSEQGDIDLIVMADGTLTSGFLITGQDDGTVDATIGSGTGSLTTIAGDLAITGGNITNAVTFDSGLTGTLTGSSTSCTGQAATVATIAGLAPNTATTAASQPNITTLAGFLGGTANALITDDGDGTVTSESNLTFDSSELLVQSTSAGYPRVHIKSNANTTYGPQLKFTKDRGAAPADGDTIGNIIFMAEDSAQNSTQYAAIGASIEETTDGQEGAHVVISLASHDGELVTGFELIDGDAEDEIDVNVASGTSSLTTIAGKLKIFSGIDCEGEDFRIINADVSIGQSHAAPIDGFTVFADTPSFHSQATSGPLFTIKNQKNDANGAILRFAKDKGAAGAVNDNLENIEFYGDDALQQQTLFAKIHSQAASVIDGQEGGRLSFGVASHNGTFQDAITIGDFGTTIPQIKLHTGTKFISGAENDLITWGDDGITGIFANANLDIGDYDFRAQTFTSDVATGTAPFTVSSTTQVANLNVATAGTAGAISSGTSTGDTFTFTSTNANDPLLVIQNTTNDSSGPRLKLFNNRGAAGVDDDLAGSILFAALNDGSSEVTSGSIECQQTTKTANAEESKFSFYLRDGDASSREVLDLRAASSILHSDLLTIKGNLTVTAGTSGDATLIISADTDDSNETDNPRLWFKADGDIIQGAIQHNSNTFDIISNVGGGGGIRFLTGTTNNTGTTDPSTGATERMSIASDGTITVDGITSTPSSGAAISLNGSTADGSPYIEFTQNGTRRTFIQHNDTDNTLKLSSEYGAISLLTGTTGTNEAERLGISSAGDVTISSSLTVDDINLDSKTITLTGSTGDTCAIACGTHGATTITTTDASAAQANLTFAIDGAISSTSTSFSAITDDFTIASSTSAHPTLMIAHTGDNSQGGELVLHNKRGAAGVNGDICGLIHFKAPNHDGSDNFIFYSSIVGSIVESNDTDEAGKLELYVATSNDSASAPQIGLVLTGSGSDNDIDVTIGYGSTSLTTVNGRFRASGLMQEGENTIITQRLFTKTSSTDGSREGDVVLFGSTTSMITGRIYHYNSSGNWELANPNAAATSDGLLGVALGAASDTNGVLLRGMVTLDHDPGAVGDVLFLNKDQVADTGGTDRYGAATATSPNGNGDIVRIIGYCLDASNGQIWFNPDNTFVEYSVGD